MTLLLWSARACPRFFANRPPIPSPLREARLAGRPSHYFRAAVFVLAVVALFSINLTSRAADQPAKPKIRAVTAFVRLDRAQYKSQIADAIAFLHKAKAAFQKFGYEVETIRITTQPFPEYTRDLAPDKAVAFLVDYDALAQKEGFDAAIGPAMMKDSDDAGAAEILELALAKTKTLEASIVIAGEDGVHWQSIRAAALIVKYLEANSPHGIASFNFTASALVPSGTPFYPASYFTGEGKQFAIGLESSNVVAEALASEKNPDAAVRRLRDSLGKFASDIENTSKQLDSQTGWKYGGIDLSPAPLKGVTIGGAIEKFYGAPVGSSGTLTVAALITRALKEISVTHAGYSGLMLPIMEDSVLAQRWSEGRLNMDTLLSYSAVCGTGLDTIPLPGDVSREQLERIYADVASLAVKWHKPLSARLQPAPGREPGEMTEFDDPFLVNAKIQPLP
jgi:uncharacterized protein (UPF0210 family)